MLDTKSREGKVTKQNKYYSPEQTSKIYHPLRPQN